MEALAESGWLTGGAGGRAAAGGCARGGGVEVPDEQGAASEAVAARCGGTAQTGCIIDTDGGSGIGSGGAAAAGGEGTGGSMGAECGPGMTGGDDRICACWPRSAALCNGIWCIATGGGVWSTVGGAACPLAAQSGGRLCGCVSGLGMARDGWCPDDGCSCSGGNSLIRSVPPAGTRPIAGSGTDGTWWEAEGGG